MSSSNRQYIIDNDEAVLRYRWSSYNQAQRENKLQKIEKELYEKICKELSNEKNIGE